MPTHFLVFFGRVGVVLLALPSFAMTTAYSGLPGDGRLGMAKLTLPVRTRLSTGEDVEVGPFETGDIAKGRDLMNEVIIEGRAWPFEDEFPDDVSYRSYFLSHDAFVVRIQGDIAGCFYIKPNFPGRCSHICNGGFITAKPWRRKGIGKFMGKCFLKFAKDLGYRASYFNLVFASNEPSVRLWESLAFQRVATIPHCARLHGIDDLDTAFGYFFDLNTLPDNFNPVADDLPLEV